MNLKHLNINTHAAFNKNKITKKVNWLDIRTDIHDKRVHPTIHDLQNHGFTHLFNFNSNSNRYYYLQDKNQKDMLLRKRELEKLLASINNS